MNRFFLTYSCEGNKYNSTTKIMEDFNDPFITIIDWYIGNTVGVLIIDTPENMMHTRIKLSTFFNIKECHKIEKINDWLNNYESNNF
tara:strand:- start:521 stop:781 length:261 start_codon:yes stop_codon:yes gene_type:complete